MVREYLKFVYCPYLWTLCSHHLVSMFTLSSVELHMNIFRDTLRRLKYFHVVTRHQLALLCFAYILFILYKETAMDKAILHC